MANWFIVLLRTILLCFISLAISRFIGKSSISKATPFKFISYIVIGIIASLISLGLIPNIVFGFIALAVWLLFSIAIDYLSMRSKWIHDLINGRETILIKDGKVMEENLADVEFAVMEYTGDINVLLKSEKNPITPHDLEWKVSPSSESETVILDGNILDESLSNLGLNREWLNTQLSTSGASVDNVFIGQVDSSGDLYLDLFDDSIEVAEPKVKELLYASISKAYADLLSFSLETDDIKAKHMYSKNANILKELMDKLKPYLIR